MLINTAGLSQMKLRTLKAFKANPGEVHLVIDYLSKMINIAGIKPVDIAVFRPTCQFLIKQMLDMVEDSSNWLSEGLEIRTGGFQVEELVVLSFEKQLAKASRISVDERRVVRSLLVLK